MKFFLNFIFGLLLFDTIQGSTLPPERQIRGLNTTLRTNFNGTYERKNPCSDKEVETSSYIASHELHHHTREGDWSYYTQKCSAIISNFLQSIGNLIRFNHEPNGSFNFYLNTSISQKQAFSGNKESCNSLPTIIIEATDCKIPVNPSCPTTDNNNRNSIAEDKYPIGQFTNKETSPPNVNSGKQDGIPPFGTQQIPQDQFPLAGLDPLQQSTPKCPLRAGGEWLEVNKKPGQGDNFPILPANEFSSTSLSTPRGGMVGTDDFSQAVLNDLSQVTQSTHEPKTKYFKTSLRLTPQTDPESGTVQPRVQFTRTNLLADSTDRVSEFPEQNVALEYPLPTPRRPEPIEPFNQQSPVPISNDQLQFTTPALPFNEFPPRPIPSGDDFVPQSTTPVNPNQNPEFPTVLVQPDLAQPVGENLPMQFGPLRPFDDSQNPNIKQSEMLPGAPQNNYFPDGQIQKPGLNPFLEQRFNGNMPNQISGSGSPLVDNLPRQTLDVNGPQYDPSPFNQPPVGDYSLSAQPDTIPPRSPSNSDQSDRTQISPDSQFEPPQTPSPFEFQTQQPFDNRFPVTLSPSTDSIVTNANDVFPTTAAPMFEANGTPEYLVTNENQERFNNPTTSAGQSNFRGMTTPMPSFPNYDSFVTPFPRFDEETLPSDISVDSSDFNLRNSPLDQQLNDGDQPTAPSPTLANQETFSNSEQTPPQESFPPPPPQVALGDESVIERPNYPTANPTFFDETVNNPQPVFNPGDSQNIGVPQRLPNDVNQFQSLTNNQFQSSTPSDGVTNQLPFMGPKQTPTNVEQGISGNFANLHNPNGRFDSFTPTFTPEEFSPSPDAQSFTPERDQEPFSPPAQLPTDRTVPQLYQGNPNAGIVGEVPQGKFGNSPTNPTVTEPDNFTPFMYTTPRYTTPGYDSQLDSVQTPVPGSVNNNFVGSNSASGFSENGLTTDSTPLVANPFPEKGIAAVSNPSSVNTNPENGGAVVSEAKQPNQELNFNRQPAFPEFVGPVFPEGQSLEITQGPSFFPSSPVPNDFANVNREQQPVYNISSDSPMPSQQISFNDQSLTTPVPVTVTPGNQNWDENIKQTTPVNVLNDEPSNQPNGQIFENTNNPSFPVQDMTVPLNPSVQNPVFNPALMSDSQIAEVVKNNGLAGIPELSSRSETFGNEPNVPPVQGFDEQMRAQQSPNFQDSLVTPRMPPTPEFSDYTTPQDVQKPEMTQNYNNQPINPVTNSEIGTIPTGRDFDNSELTSFGPQQQQQLPFVFTPGDNFRRPNPFGSFNGDVPQITDGVNPPNTLEQMETNISGQELQPSLTDTNPNENNETTESTPADLSSSVEQQNDFDSFQTVTPSNANIPNQSVANTGEFPQQPFSKEMSLRDIPQTETNSPQFVPATAADSEMTTDSPLFVENDQNIQTPGNPQLPFTPAPSQQQVSGLNSGFNPPLPPLKINPDEDTSSTALGTLSHSFPVPETVNQNLTPVPFDNQPNLVPSGESQSPEQGMQQTEPINFQRDIPNQFIGDSVTDKSLISPVQRQQLPGGFDYTTTNIQNEFPLSQNRPLTELQLNNPRPILNPEFSNDQAPQFNENLPAPQPPNFINQPLLNNLPSQEFSSEPFNSDDQTLPQATTPAEDGTTTETPFQPSELPTDADMMSQTSPPPNPPDMSNINNSNQPFYPRQTFNQFNGEPVGNFGPRFFPGNPENNQQIGNSNLELESKDFINQPSYNQAPGPMFAPAQMSHGPNFINQPLRDSLQSSQLPNNQQPKPTMTDDENSLQTTTTIEEETITEVPIQLPKSAAESDMKPETFPTANQPDMGNGNYPVQPFDPRQSFNQSGGKPIGNFRGPVLESPDNFNRPNFNPGFPNTQGPIFYRNGFAPAQGETFVHQPRPQGPVINGQQQPMIPEGRPLSPPEQNLSPTATAVEESTSTGSSELVPKFPSETGATDMKPEPASNIPNVYPNQPFDSRQAFNQPNGEPVGNFEPRFFPGNPENRNQQFGNPNLGFPADNSFNRPNFSPDYPDAQGPTFYNNGDAIPNNQQIPGSGEDQQPTPTMTQVQSLPSPAQNMPQSTTTAEEDATTVTPFPPTTTPKESDVIYDTPPPSNHPNMSNINYPIQPNDSIKGFNRGSVGNFPENPENYNQRFGNPNLRFPVYNLQNSFNNPNFRPPGNNNQQYANPIPVNNPVNSLITPNFNQGYPNRQESLLYRNGGVPIQIPEDPNSINQFLPNNVQSPNDQQPKPITTDDKSTQTETTTEESTTTETQLQLPKPEASYPDMRNVNYPVDQVFNQPNGGFDDNFRRPVFPVGPGYNGQEVETQNNFPNSFNGFNGNRNNPNVQAPVFYGNGGAPAPGGPNFLNQPLPIIQNPSSPNDQQPIPLVSNNQQPVPSVSNDQQLSQTTTTTIVETTTTKSPSQPTTTPSDSEKSFPTAMKPELLRANRPDMRNGNYPIQPFDPRQGFINNPNPGFVGNFGAPGNNNRNVETLNYPQDSTPFNGTPFPSRVGNVGPRISNNGNIVNEWSNPMTKPSSPYLVSGNLVKEVDVLGDKEIASDGQIERQPPVAPVNILPSYPRQRESDSSQIPVPNDVPMPAQSSPAQFASEGNPLVNPLIEAMQYHMGFPNRQSPFPGPSDLSFDRINRNQMIPRTSPGEWNPNFVNSQSLQGNTPQDVPNRPQPDPRALVPDQTAPSNGPDPASTGRFDFVASPLRNSFNADRMRS